MFVCVSIIWAYIHTLTLISSRVLGTPTEETWPGLMSLPDYNVSFPQCKGKSALQFCPTLDPLGADLLSVYIYIYTHTYIYIYIWVRLII